MLVYACITVFSIHGVSETLLEALLENNPMFKLEKTHGGCYFKGRNFRGFAVRNFLKKSSTANILKNIHFCSYNIKQEAVSFKICVFSLSLL